MSLILQDVKKSYREPGGTVLPILNIARFELADGEQMALLGPSGGGKTTLLNVISGITAPDSGSVLIDGVDLAKLHEVGRDRFRARKIGFVFQTFNLLPAFTALENVLVGMTFAGQGADRSRAVHLLERVGLAHRLHHRPPQMSVGEQQRVAVARALANRPSLVLADEPTANVDPSNQQNILDLIRESCREGGVSLLMVTHSLEAAGQFDRVNKLTEFNHPRGQA
ncbi:MAG TPA: ABC transporter ATP-binding protein [Planctomycetaceae bacterium]|jgi:putative ABC transport system ATP-binding protein|nr:ABC transporter ATP-binding protein [Planctomycetaceae bacterium]